METSAKRLVLKPEIPSHPNPDGLTAVTEAQLLDAQTQLEAACNDKHLTKMLKGVVTNMHYLMSFSREAGLTPLLGPARYIYAYAPQESGHFPQSTH